MGAASPLDELLTVRDWLRFGVSQFRAAGLVFGHGSTNALDEAAYLLMHVLHLPRGELEPWLEARLTREERTAVHEIFQKRITTRKPASYLTGEAWIEDFKFHVDENVIVPRSFIGELLARALRGEPLWFLEREPEDFKSVLELCTGSGCLAILAAHAYPNAQIVASDLSADALAVAKRNVDDYGLEDRIKLQKADLFDGLQPGLFNLIIANPPYVSAAEVAAFPPEYKAEPEMAHSGGEDGLALVHRILADAGPYLTADGALIVEVGTGRDLLEAEYSQLPFSWLDTEESEGEVFALPAKALQGTSRIPATARTKVRR
jgi:ribosomal protein L3 glutamine methyltransferase